MRALGHPARLILLRACREGPRAAGDLVALTNLAPASVSEHLRVLRTVGLLELQQRGRFWLYRTSPAVVGSVATALVEMADL